MLTAIVICLSLGTIFGFCIGLALTGPRILELEETVENLRRFARGFGEEV